MRPRRAHHDPGPGESLAQVVVGVPEQAHGDAAGHEGAEALAGRAAEGEVDGPVGQPGAAVPAGDLVAEEGAHRAVHVGHHHVGASPGCRPRWRGGRPRGSCGRAPSRGRGPDRACGGGPRPPGRRVPAGWGRGRARMPSSGRPRGLRRAGRPGPRPPPASGARGRPGTRGPPRRCTRRRSRRTRACRCSGRAGSGSGWRSRPGRCRDGRPAS